MTNLQRITAIENIMKEYCEQHENIDDSQRNASFRSYSAQGLIYDKSSRNRLDYYFECDEDDTLVFFQKSKYTPLYAINNISSLFEDKVRMFQKLDAIMNSFFN